MSKKMIALIVILALIVGLVAFLVFSWRSESEKNARASLCTLGEGREKISLTIDGEIEKSWDRFKWREITLGTSPRRSLIVYLVNDDQNLYLAIKAIHDTVDEGRKDFALLCFLLSDELKIEAGKFKTVKIFGDGTVLWQSWEKMEKLPVRYVHRYEDYAEDLKAQVGRNEAIRAYDGNKIVNGEKVVYALFAYNMKDIPEGLIAKTSFQNHRTYEAKIPLNSLGVKPGQTIRIFGYIYDYTIDSDTYYPNNKTRSLASAAWYSEIVTFKVKGTPNQH